MEEIIKNLSDEDLDGLNAIYELICLQVMRSRGAKLDMLMSKVRLLTLAIGEEEVKRIFVDIGKGVSSGFLIEEILLNLKLPSV